MSHNHGRIVSEMYYTFLSSAIHAHKRHQGKDRRPCSKPRGCAGESLSGQAKKIRMRIYTKRFNRICR